jgi:site-specific DNA-methyltransferase (adenine-specific)
MVEITLYNGDCLQVMKELPAQSVDLIICDLPYGCLSSGDKKPSRVVDLRYDTGKTKPLNTYGVGGCEWDIKINLEEFWKEIRRIRKNEHTPCIHFCTTKFGYELIQSNPAEFRYDLVWDKEQGVSFLSANKMPMRSHEMIYVFSKAGAFYNRIDIESDGKPYNVIKKDTQSCATLINTQYNAKRITSSNDGKTRCALSVINMKKTASHKQSHPTEKPNDLYRWLIERYCPVGGTVLDPTFGSGNSVFTSYEMGRNAIGIEMNEGFFNKAVERLELP